LLESRILGIRPQVRALLGEGRRLNEGQHAVLLSITLFFLGKGNCGRAVQASCGEWLVTGGEI